MIQNKMSKKDKIRIALSSLIAMFFIGIAFATGCSGGGSSERRQRNDYNQNYEQNYNSDYTEREQVEDAPQYEQEDANVSFVNETHEEEAAVQTEEVEVVMTNSTEEEY